MAEERKFVIFRGRQVIEGWPERVAEAQIQDHYVIGGQRHGRIRYGDEADDWSADTVSCHDCRVIKGEFHVPSCDVEQCPACGEQACACGCDYEGDESGD